jgi:hypothetical protein
VKQGRPECKWGVAAPWLLARRDTALADSTVNGTIEDPTGARIANSAIVVLDAHGSVLARAASDGAGTFRIDGLPPGDLDMIVQAEGFAMVGQRVSISGAGFHLSLSLYISPARSAITTATRRGAVDNVRDAPHLIATSGSRETPQFTVCDRRQRSRWPAGDQHSAAYNDILGEYLPRRLRAQILSVNDAISTGATVRTLGYALQAAPHLGRIHMLIFGATTLTFDVPSESAAAAGGLMANSGGDAALPSGRLAPALRSEYMTHFEGGLRMESGAVYAGMQATSVTPRAVHSNVSEGAARYYGVESLAQFRLSPNWIIEANYCFLVGPDLLNPNRPARRLPPQRGYATLRHTSSNGRYWGRCRPPSGLTVSSQWSAPQR